MTVEAASCGIPLLVVDDEEELCAEIVSYLDRRGYRCRAAYNAQQAMDVLGGGFRPAVVLANFWLPGGDSSELIRYLRQRHTYSRIIVLSGHAALGGADPMRGLGVDARLVKPIDARDLWAKIEEVLRQ